MIDAGVGAPGLKGARLTPRDPGSPTGSSPRHAGTGVRSGGRAHREQAVRWVAAPRRGRRGDRVAGGLGVSRGAAPDPTGAVHASSPRRRLREWTAEMVAPPDPGDRRADRGARDHPPSGKRRSRPRGWTGGRRPVAPEHPAGRHPRRAGDDRIGAGAGPRRSAHRSRRGTRRARDEPESSRNAAAGPDGGRRRRELRRAVVYLHLAAHCRGDPDRGQRDRRRQNASRARSRAARRGDRDPRLHRRRLVHRFEHERLRARHPVPLGRPASDRRGFRLDDRAGHRHRRGDQLC